MFQPNLARLLRYIETCRNARLPGERIPFRIGAAGVGWVKPEFAKALSRFPEIRLSERAVVLENAKAAKLNEIAAELAAAGLFRWRNEPFDVREQPNGAVLGQLDRGALPLFGVLAEGVHCNCLVKRGAECWLWVARRAPHKLLDPDKLDHLVAGGIPSGLSPREALIKEAAEEAGIPAELAAKAQEVGRIPYAMERPEGLRRDLLHCFDLVLPEDFVPRAIDGEIASFALWPLSRVLQTVLETEEFKFNVNLVLIDLFLRTGVIDPFSSEGRLLHTALHGSG
jgi:8-oxo-dGTP pyrophosphatase MutT (NUDIX family)